MSVFDEIYEVVKKIPRGRVMTYGQVAAAVGMKDVRKVGWALHSNKTPETIPCHRVVFKDGSLAPGYAFGGLEAQKKKLVEERVIFVGEKVNLDKCGMST
ncbi:MAG: MGMT family protein [Patescibacteria group bacterium]